MDVRPFVEDLARSGVERFRPSYVASHTSADVSEAHAILTALADEGELDAHFEVICSNDVCHRAIARYDSVDEVPIGATIACASCGGETTVTLRNVWAYYTPSRGLLLRVNR